MPEQHHPQSSLHVEDPPPRDKKSLPKWTAFALLGGSTILLGLPLVFLRRRQKSMLEQALKDTQPPPRRSGASAIRYSLPMGRKPASLPASQPHEGKLKDASESDLSLPGIGEMFGAMSKMSLSTAMLGAKAFGIATCIVGVGAFVTVVTVKAVMGIDTAHEFGQRVREIMWSTFPGLTSSIHRPSEAKDELVGSAKIHPDEVENWSLDTSEERLRKAFEKGGLPAWGAVAMKEVEIEAQLERDRRRQS